MTGADRPAGSATRHLRARALPAWWPASGSPAARMWAHVLECDRCFDVALAALTAVEGELAEDSYDEAFRRAEERLVAAYRQLMQSRLAATALCEELAGLPETERMAEIGRRMRRDPWGTVDAFLTQGRLLVRTVPHRARWLAELAQAALASQALLESVKPAPAPRPDDDSATYRETLAVATDLRLDERQLREIGRGRTAHSLDAVDAKLAGVAAECAQRVLAAVRDLEIALRAHRLERDVPRGRHGAAGRRRSGR